MVFDDDESDLREFLQNPASRVGQNDRLHTKPRKNAHREGHLLNGVTFVKMHTPLHCDYWGAGDFADNHVPRMTDRRGSREIGDFGIRNSDRTRELVSKCPKSRAEDQAYPRAEPCL